MFFCRSQEKAVIFLYRFARGVFLDKYLRKFYATNYTKLYIKYRFIFEHSQTSENSDKPDFNLALQL